MSDAQTNIEAAEGATAFGSTEFENLLKKEFRP